MTLDTRGIIAAVEVAVYAIVAVLTGFLVYRHGYSRQSGWIFLFIFSTVRLVGGAILISAETAKTTSVGLFTAAFILESIGLSPLLLGTLGFLGVVGQVTRSGVPLIHHQILRLLRVSLTVALVLSAVGGSKSVSSNPDELSTGSTLRKVGALMFAALYIVITMVHVIFWKKSSDIFSHRRTLLIAISAALPFLAIRVLYSILSSFSPSSSSGSGTLGHANPNSLSKFNTVTGEWQVYLGMALIMEFVVVCIYCVAGIILPITKKSDADDEGRVQANEGYPLVPSKPY